MADKEAPAKAANTVPANPQHINWPTVNQGFTSLMRREGLRSAGRIKDNEAKLEQYLTDLSILAKHAKARYAATVARKEREAAARAAALEADRVRAETDKAERIAELRAEAEKLAIAADVLENGEAGDE